MTKSATSPSSNSTVTATASCAAGQIATGGGGSASSSNDYLYENMPKFTGTTPTGWQVSGAKSGGSGNYTVTAYVLCGPAS